MAQSLKSTKTCATCCVTTSGTSAHWKNADCWTLTCEKWPSLLKRKTNNLIWTRSSSSSSTRHLKPGKSCIDAAKTEPHCTFCSKVVPAHGSLSKSRLLRNRLYTTYQRQGHCCLMMTFVTIICALIFRLQTGKPFSRLQITNNTGPRRRWRFTSNFSSRCVG